MADTEPTLLNLSPEQEANLRIILARGGSSARIDTTTQQIKNCVMAALTECGLVEGGPISVTERQGIAIRTVLTEGNAAVSLLIGLNGGEAPRIAHRLGNVLDALRREFGL